MYYPATKVDIRYDELTPSYIDFLVAYFSFMIWCFQVLYNVLREHYIMPRRLLMTGTPIQNSLTELWALLQFCMTSIFGTLEHFCATFKEGGDPFSGFILLFNILLSVFSQCHICFKLTVGMFGTSVKLLEHV